VATTAQTAAPRQQQVLPPQNQRVLVQPDGNVNVAFPPEQVLQPPQAEQRPQQKPQPAQKPQPPQKPQPQSSVRTPFGEIIRRGTE
jgi:hypothetical protein